MAVFLIPSAALLAALYIFPFLVDYLSTGNVGNAPVILVNPDASVQKFVSTDTLASTYTYKIWTNEEYESSLTDGRAADAVTDGSFFVVFLSQPDEGNEDYGFDYSEAVLAFFEEAANGNSDVASTAVVAVYFDPGTIQSYTMARQFEQTVLPRYSDYLVESVGRSIYQAGGGDPFTVDSFHPYTKIMENRSRANPAGARVIPGVIILLLYYCVYSLSGDMLAADRERGFLSKITLTPISTRALIWGKALAISSISVLTSAITLFVILLSSWFNRTNNPLSLIPYGLLLTPSQTALIIGSIFCASILMTMYCFKVILDLHKMQDILLNLQLPLLLFLADFFLQLFRPSEAVLVEYIIPLHNNLLLIHDVMIDHVSLQKYIFVLLYDLAIVFLLFSNARRKFEPETASIISQRSIV
jgi:hypothetical protein